MEAIRKLIDIKAPVFYALSAEASKKKVSLKRLIEDMLEKAAGEHDASEGGTFASASVARLAGSAKPGKMAPEMIDDDRLQYILSK